MLGLEEEQVVEISGDHAKYKVNMKSYSPASLLEESANLCLTV